MLSKHAMCLADHFSILLCQSELFLSVNFGLAFQRFRPRPQVPSHFGIKLCNSFALSGVCRLPNLAFSLIHATYMSFVLVHPSLQCGMSPA